MSKLTAAILKMQQIDTQFDLSDPTPKNMIPENRTELQQLISNPVNVTNGRLCTDEMFYKTYLEHMPKEVKETVLQTQIEMAKIKHSIPTSSLIPNSFPYSRILEKMPRVKHYCLWLPANSTANPEVEIFKWILVLFPDHYKTLEFDFYQNSKENQTVKHIDHFQVFIHF